MLDTTRGMCVFNTRLLRFRCACLFNRHDALWFQSQRTSGLLSRSLMLRVLDGFPAALVASRAFPHGLASFLG